jgi:hypothetical protein
MRRTEKKEFLFAIRHAGKLGFIDARGEVVISPRFQNDQLSDAHHEGSVDFSDVVPVMLKSRWGYIDAAGRFVIEPSFELARWFSDGLAAVGQITRRSYGIADGRWGYIDRAGALVIPYQFAGAEDFQAGRAVVVIPGKDGDLVAHGGERIIDRKGVVVGKPKKFRFVPPPPTGEPVAAQKGGRWGFRDAKGKLLIPYQFDEAWDFSEGRAAVRVGKLWGFVDLKGRVVIAPQFLEGSSFTEGRAQAKVKLKVGGRAITRFGFVDPEGQMVIAPRFTKADERDVSFEHGLAAVVLDNARAYVDRTGRLVWKEKKE